MIRTIAIVTCSASMRRTCPRVHRPARPIGRTCSASLTASTKRRNGRLRSPACPPRSSGGSRLNSPPASRPRCKPAMLRAALCMGNSFIVPHMRWRRSPAMLVIVGGNSGTSNGATGRMGIKTLPIGENPTGARVSTPLLADLLARGKAGGYPSDIKLIYSAGGGLFNQAPNTGKIAASLDGVEFIVGQDHFLTPTVRMADIVLPATTFWERNDVHVPWSGAGHYAIFMRQAIEPMYECRNDIDIFTDLARRVGITGYNDKNETEWLREFTRGPIDDFDAFTEQGVARFPAPADAVAFAAQIRDPDNHRFKTPSGKIEVYSTTLAAKPDLYGLGVIPPIPTWIAPPGPDAAFPLMLCSPKSRARTHSTHGNQPGLARVDPDDVWINTEDAAARGIANGQRVRIFNDQGATVLPALVTDRIAPGVVSIKEGAWFTPDESGTDTKGCANALAIDRSAPCGATTYNTNYVQVSIDDRQANHAGS